MSELLRFGESLFPYLLDAVWKATALLVIVFVLSWVLGRRRLVARYWLSVYCFAGLLLLPLTSFVARDHRLALLPSKEPTTVLDADSEPSEPVAPIAARPKVDDEADLRGERGTEMKPVLSVMEQVMVEPLAVDAEDAEAVPEEGAEERAASGGMDSEEDVHLATEEAITPEPSTVTFATPEPRDEGTAAVPVAVLQEPQPITGSRASSPFPWRSLITLGWLAGCTAFLLRLLPAVVGLVRVRRASSPVSVPAVVELFEEAKRAAGFKTKAELRVSRRVASPVSVGILRPIILLPKYLPHEMPLEQLQPILLHELAHIRWRDYTINMVQRLTQAIFFFHPLVHLLNRRLRALREEICDYWVMNHCRSAVLYAKALITLAERLVMPQKGLIGVGLFNHRLHLPERIKRILNSGKGLPTTIRLRTAIALLSVSTLVVGALSIASLSARAAKAEKKKDVEGSANEHEITWKDDVVYRDGKPYAKIVQWEPEADLPMIAFGDQNENGTTDTWIRFLNGKPLRIEIDSNEDGRIDKWEHYFQGLIDLVEQDTDFNRRVDLWQVYDNGKLFREEIDLNADGSVDKWLEADEQGKLVEKEIVSWVVGRLLRASGRGSFGGTFFNARNRVEKIEEGLPPPPGSATAGASGSTAKTASGGARTPSSAYRASTGSRIETVREIKGKKVVCGWYHVAVSDTESFDSPGMWVQSRKLFSSVTRLRHSAVDLSLDGGVDSWEQIGPPLSEERKPGSRGNALFEVTCEDTNRDGKADRCRIFFRRNAEARQVGRSVNQVDTSGDGLVDKYESEWERSKVGRVDTDLDGVFDSFADDRVPWQIEASGTGKLRLESKLVGGENPPRLLCKLNQVSQRESTQYRRAFWLVPGETVNVSKLSRGSYDLEVSVLLSELPERFVSGVTPTQYAMVTLSYPSFLVLEKGQTVSETFTWDARPVFRGRLISANATPMDKVTLRLSLPGESPASVSVVTDDAGDFDLFNVPPGKYVLSGPRSIFWAGGVTESEDPLFEEAIEIAAPREAPPRRHVMITIIGRENAKLPPGWEAPLAMSGKVLSHEGEPLCNMRLQVSRRDKRREISRNDATGLDGSYRIVALPPGRYWVSIYNNDFGQTRESKPIEQFDVQIEKTPMHKDFRLSGPMPVAVE